MRAWDERYPGLLPDRNAVQQLHVEGGGDHRDIDEVTAELVEDVVAPAISHGVGDKRKLLAEACDPSGQQIGGASFYCPDAQFTA